MAGSSWQSPAWPLLALVVGMVLIGFVGPIELSDYARAHQYVAPVETLESSFQIAYLGQWSGFGNHWYNYTVTLARPGMVWGDLWMTVYFNGTTTPLPTGLGRTVVNNGSVGVFSWATGQWGAKGEVAQVISGQTMSVDTAEFLGDGNILFIAAINGTVSGTESLTIP